MNTPSDIRTGTRQAAVALGCALAIAGSGASAAPGYAPVEAGSFASVLPGLDVGAPVEVAAFALRTEPVTEAEFLAFVKAHPQWRRDRAPRLLAEPRYLQHWPAAERIDPEKAQWPVTSVSWFAARAYCESEQARLPTWHEWEYAAAADATRRDARTDPAWRERILGWYSRPNGDGPGPIGGEANAYGVRDLHGLVWEWVDDANALLVSADNREQGDPDRQKFCGAGALSMQDRENYAVLMRIAMLSSLGGADVTTNLGFRCARPAANGEPR